MSSFIAVAAAAIARLEEGRLKGRENRFSSFFLSALIGDEGVAGELRPEPFWVAPFIHPRIPIEPRRLCSVLLDVLCDVPGRENGTRAKGFDSLRCREMILFSVSRFAPLTYWGVVGGAVLGAEPIIPSLTEFTLRCFGLLRPLVLGTTGEGAPSLSIGSDAGTCCCF